MASTIQHRPMNIEQELEHLAPDARRRRKAELFRDCGIPLFYTYNGIRFVLLAPLRAEGDKLVVEISAFEGERKLFIDSPIVFINPPILVPDDGAGLREDLIEAFKEIVYQVVRVQN